ncbi:MAG: hypothetical protein ACTHMS_02300 [Jatrophihabitans sp.]|uniref:hypothetical protein n=1 Tax=Jatrophihabitans sp. TaxID=1932789 RepID=UPI003F81088D
MSSPHQPPGQYPGQPVPPPQAPQQQVPPPQQPFQQQPAQQPGLPPAGYPPGGWAPATQQLPAATPTRPMVGVLGLVSVLGIVVGLSVSEDGRTGWDSVNAWGGLALVGAVLAAAGAWGPAFGLRGPRAPQLALVGAGLLGLFWVLLVLPAVGSNTSLVTTIGVLAGVAAAWRSQPPDGGAAGGTPSW